MRALPSTPTDAISMAHRGSHESEAEPLCHRPIVSEMPHFRRAARESAQILIELLVRQGPDLVA
jgi:hypothetical protein